MNKFNLTDLIYSKINLDKLFKSCVMIEDTNVIEIEAKDGSKFLLLIEDVD